MFRDLLANEPPVAVLYSLLAEGVAMVVMGVWVGGTYSTVCVAWFLWWCLSSITVYGESAFWFNPALRWLT